MRIWEEAKGDQAIANHACDIYRVVESQSHNSTRKLVDSDSEQELLEHILEASKPVAPTHNERGELHYLLFTPFRYPPLQGGGRFHRITEQSLFYGSITLETAMAEVAYRRFLFAAHSDASFHPMRVHYDHFVVGIDTERFVALESNHFAPWHHNISDPTSYQYSQPLGTDMREADVEGFSYASARMKGGINVGLFTPEVFTSNQLADGDFRGWDVFVSEESVEFTRRGIRKGEVIRHSFYHADFCVDGTFPVVGND